ncbi:MAG: hypothetical protein IPM29_32310 [Planctomycetes bacterium]|nr:hypothetical protein [Planctomycetota bacterium]
MCYVVHLLTDSPADLSVHDSPLVRFERATVASLEEALRHGRSLVELPHLWCVGTRSGCGCTLRHVATPCADLWFGPPVDWYPEGQDDLDATKELYAVLVRLVHAGHRVDVLDHWWGDAAAEFADLDVSLDQVDAESFRLFDKHRFRLRA